MFYGLNKFVKNILPKQLFYRGLLIVALPVIIIQITITLVFFDSLFCSGVCDFAFGASVLDSAGFFLEVFCLVGLQQYIA